MKSLRTQHLFWAILITLTCQGGIQAQSAIGLVFNNAGLSSLRYQGTEFLSYGDLRLNQVTFQNADGSTSAGGTASTVSVDASQQTQSRAYSWGSITDAYSVSGTRLNLTVTVRNQSPLPIKGIWMDVLGLRFPTAVQEYDGNTPLVNNTLGQPVVQTMTYGSGVMALAVDDPAKPLQIGFPYAFDRPGNSIFPLIISTDRVFNLPDSFPTIVRPIAAGASDQYHFSLRFGPPGSTAGTLALDAFQAFAAAFPPTLSWPDRRPIGSLILSSSNTGYPTNPRGWLLDRTIDVTTPAGVAAFRQRILTWADNSVTILKNMNAQGMITWDIEGEQFPHAITYVCDPRVFATTAPEMAGIADDYFQKFRDAGLRVGVCIRPQQFVLAADKLSAQQNYVPDPTQILIDKINFARSRWGATLFYVDSNVKSPSDPNPIDPAIFKTLQAMYPDSLFVPEHSVTQYWAYSAPYRDIKQGYFATPMDARLAYPNAFTILETADAPLQQNFNTMVSSVQKGDVLLFRGWFPDPGNSIVQSIYQAAGGPSVTVSLSPQSGTLNAGQSQQFAATVSGTSNSAIYWSSTPPELGSISNTGLFLTSNSVVSPQTVTVRATSAADLTRSATAVWTINPVQRVAVSISPQTGTLSAGQSLQFSPTVTGSTNQQVAWVISPAGFGSISGAGLYTAPASVAAVQVVQIKAVSAADSSQSAVAMVTVNPLPVVTISISPVTTAVTSGQSVQFAASVGGSGNQQVTWSATSGSISSSGLFVSPSGVTSQQTTTITATSVADSTKKAPATVTINPLAVAVAVSVTPPSSSLGLGQSQQFNASVTGTADQRVSWSINPAAGIISSNGNYTAPASLASPQTISVVATSLADSTKSATATVSVNPTVTISMSPMDSTVYSGQSIQFTASVGGTSNQQVTWSTNNGTISSDGLYVSPAGNTGQQRASITVTSVADPNKKAFGSVTINAAPPSNVSISPQFSSIGVGQSIQFSSSVTGNADQRVAWAINPAGAGTISSSGFYTAPASVASQQNVSVTATSLADPSKSSSALVTINPPAPVTIVISPPSATVTTGQSVQFSSSVGGTGNQQVSWSASVGSISGSGLFVAPSGINSQQTATITATSAADSTKKASATVTINPPAAIAVFVSPQASSIGVGQTGQFTATVTGTSDPRVSWTTSPAGVGSISSNGTYSAPSAVSSPQTITVTATSLADPTKSAVATLTVNPTSRVTVSITPGFATVAPGQSLRFISTVTGTGNQDVYWMISPSGNGDISNTGYYTAPSSISFPRTVQIMATSVKDPASTTAVTVTLTPAVVGGVVLTPVNSVISSGDSIQYQAVVSGTSNQNVYWSVTPTGTGAISNNGLYTAPSNVGSQLMITVSATSVTDPNKMASATVFINPRQ